MVPNSNNVSGGGERGINLHSANARLVLMAHPNTRGKTLIDRYALGTDGNCLAR